MCKCLSIPMNVVPRKSDCESIMKESERVGYVYKYIHTFIHVCIYIRIYIHAYTQCVCVCIYVYIIILLVKPPVYFFNFEFSKLVPQQHAVTLFCHIYSRHFANVSLPEMKKCKTLECLL